MPEILQYSFMVRALAAGLIIAIIVPLLGAFLVARRYSLISDGLAHVSLAGVGAGLLLGIAPLAAALPVAAGGAVLLEWLRQRKQLSGEVSLAILMSGGLAVAVVLASMAQGANMDFTSYLFGSIATTTMSDLITLGLVGCAVLLVVAFNYRALLHISFDEDSARIAGHRVTALNYLLTLLTAVVVVLSLRIVGGLLISALLVIPVVTAGKLARSFGQTIFLGIICGAVAVIGGLIIAFYVGVAAGAAIVLSALFLLLIALVWK